MAFADPSVPVTRTSHQRCVGYSSYRKARLAPFAAWEAALISGIIAFCSIYASAQATPDINVKNYGAKGDGSSDDTAAIRAAFNAATAGGTVYFPCGIYAVNPNQPFTPHSGTVVSGAGAWCSAIRYTGTRSGQTLFSLQYDEANSYGREILFEGLMIEGSNVPGTNCVYAGSTGNPKTQHITFRNVKITQCDPGVKTGDVWYLVFDNSLLEWNYGDAVEFHEPNAVTGAFFENGTRIGNNGGNGIVHDGSGVVVQLVVRDSEVSYNGKTEIVTGNARDVAIESVWLEESSTPRDGIDLTGCLSCTVNEVHSDHACRAVVSASVSSGVRIERSSFTNTSRTPIVLQNKSTGQVSNNRADVAFQLPASMTAGNNDSPALRSGVAVQTGPCP